MPVYLQLDSEVKGLAVKVVWVVAATWTLLFMALLGLEKT